MFKLLQHKADKFTSITLAALQNCTKVAPILYLLCISFLLHKNDLQTPFIVSMQEKRVTAKATTDHKEILYAGGQQGVVLKETGDERVQ